jgi:uncharacterized membrane protein
LDLGKAVTWPLGVGVGAALGYFLDPESGRRRRHLLQDKATHFRRVGATGARKALADAENRMRGVVAGVRSRVHEGEHETPDDVLERRVRSRLGHVLTHPKPVEVHVQRGTVTLRGPVLESEVDRAVRDIRMVPGVHRVVDDLERFESAEDVPALQGGRERRGRGLLGGQWSPAYRLFGMASSLPLLGFGLRERGASGGVVAGLGASLLARSLVNQPLGKILGWGAGARVLELRRHFVVAARPEEVFSELQDPKNLCDLLSQVESITPGSRKGCWEVVATGPAGLPLRFEVEITDLVQNRHVAWRSREGGRLEMEGTLHLSERDGSGTEIDLELHYNPPGGMLGEALATLLGAGLDSNLKDDIPRIQRLFEAPRTGEGRQESSWEVTKRGEKERPAEERSEASSSRGEPRSESRGEAGKWGEGAARSGAELKTGGDPRMAPESGDRPEARRHN